MSRFLNACGVLSATAALTSCTLPPDTLTLINNSDAVINVSICGSDFQRITPKKRAYFYPSSMCANANSNIMMSGSSYTYSSSLIREAFKRNSQPFFGTDTQKAGWLDGFMTLKRSGARYDITAQFDEGGPIRLVPATSQEPAPSSAAQPAGFPMMPTSTQETP